MTEYARLSRALMLFQTGRPADAVLQLDDLRVSMLGCALVSSRSDSGHHLPRLANKCHIRRQHTGGDCMPLIPCVIKTCVHLQ